jgi:hypothetical protein
MNQQPVNYGNAEARGKIRAWKNQLYKRYQEFRVAYNGRDSSVNTACLDLVERRSRTGRQRAVDKLQQAFGPAAKLEKVRHDGKHSYALWSILKPRDPVTVDASDDSGRNQFCVCVNYIMTGYLPHLDAIGKAEGLWTLEVPDHALGRAIERSGMLHPEVIIRDAHQNLLDLPVQLIPLNGNGAIDPRLGFFIKAGAGAFRCEIHVAPDASLNDNLAIRTFVPTCDPFCTL